MKLNQRFLSVGLTSVLGLAVLAPMASAKDNGRRDTTIALGAASIALLATNHRDAGLVGLGLTAVAAGLFDDHHRRYWDDRDVRYVPRDRWVSDRWHDDRWHEDRWRDDRFRRDDHPQFRDDHRGGRDRGRW